MRLCRPFQFAPVKVIWRVERDVDAFFGEQQNGDFPPRLAPLALLADEIEMRFQDAVIRSAAALMFFIHHHIG